MTGVQTQAMLNATAISQHEELPILPHHPLSCVGARLALHEDGTLACDHAITWPHDARTKRAVDHSIAILIIELARDTL